MRYDDQPGHVLGTVIFFRVISGTVSVITTILLIALIDRDQPITMWVAILYSSKLIFQSFESIRYWFQYKLLSKVITIASIVAYTVSLVFKIYLLVQQKNVLWFAASATFEYAVLALSFVLTYYRHNGSKYPFRVSFKLAKQIIRRSYHYIFSGTMVAIYGQIDKIIIGQYLSKTQVGYYSIALAVCTVWTFFLSAIIDSARPIIFAQSDAGSFKRHIKKLYSLIIYLSFLVSIVLTCLSKPIVKILYGAAYLPAANALKILTWSTAFSYLGVARSIWVVQKEAQRYEKYIALAGAVCNVMLNYLFIPRQGIVGAATAMLGTQIFTNLIFGFFIPHIRKNNFLILGAFNPRSLFS